MTAQRAKLEAAIRTQRKKVAPEQGGDGMSMYLAIDVGNWAWSYKVWPTLKAKVGF